MTGEVVFRLPLRHESDVARARQHARTLSVDCGFPASLVEALALATSEIARNVIVHAGEGEIVMSRVHDSERSGVAVIARDRGPGIADIDRAMSDGYSTGGGLGLGLPSARRLVHDFELRSVVGEGTTVSLTLWLP